MDDSIPDQRAGPGRLGTVDAALPDHPAAWHDLVAGNVGEVWSAARAAGLSAEDAAEVSQLTWLGLAADLDRIVANGMDVRTWLLDAVAREARVVHARSALGAGPAPGKGT